MISILLSWFGYIGDESSFWPFLPSICLSGENPLPPDDPNKELMGKTEVSLTLTNKFDVPDEANTEMDAKTLLLKWVWPLQEDLLKRNQKHFDLRFIVSSTKRLIVDVIRFQPGETLTEILDLTASPEQVGCGENEWFESLLQTDTRERPAFSHVHSVFLSLVENYSVKLRHKMGT